jgi:hypothetical protein
MTLSSNLGEFHKPGSLLLADLPRTFRDAVRIGRALGVQYLWIDALCIQQDSPEDVARELARMHDTFRDAYLVLAAVDGKDSHAGLHVDRHPAKRGGDGDSGYKYRSLKSVQRGAWRTRAWTLQEEMLARRILYFTHPSSMESLQRLEPYKTDEKFRDGQVIWSCAERIWSEDGLTNMSPEEDAPFPLERFPRRSSKRQKGSGP